MIDSPLFPFFIGGTIALGLNVLLNSDREIFRPNAATWIVFTVFCTIVHVMW